MDQPVHTHHIKESGFRTSWLAIFLFGLLMLGNGFGGAYIFHLLRKPAEKNLAVHPTLQPSPIYALPTVTPIIPTPTDAPTTYITSSHRPNSLRINSKLSNISFTFPNNWKARSYIDYDNEVFELISPGKLFMKIRTGIYGIGGYMPPIPLDKVTYEKITFLQHECFITLEPENLDVDMKPIREAVLTDNPQYTWPIEIKDVGTYGLSRKKGIHSGYTSVSLYYIDENGKRINKTVEEFKSADYEAAKDIITQATLFQEL